MKKLSALVLALILVFSLSVTASAEETSGSCGENLTWTFDNGVLTISGTGEMYDYYMNNPPWYDWRDSITKIVMEYGITLINNYAFYRCQNLTEVSIPDSVTTIYDGVFGNCPSLKSVYIPASLTSLTVGWSSEDQYCSAFDDCSSLEAIEVAAGNPAYASLDGVLYNKDFTQLIRWPGGKTSVTIPASVNCIMDFAFYYTEGLQNNNLTDIYYEGSQAQWSAIEIRDYNKALEDATIHYNSAMPTQPTDPAAPATPAIPATGTAYASTQTVSIDGKPVTLQAYALKDANGNPTNYVKLRDVAYVLNGTAAQFEVAWDGNVNIVTGQSYTANGSEMSTPFSGDRAYTIPTAQTNINGAAADLAAISLTDDNGGGYTYYQLRDLGRALGFNVGWSAERGIFIETDKPYTDAD